MEDETKKTESNTAGNKNSANATDPQANILESLAPLWKFINNPVIANAGLGAILYWVIDPKGLKGTMEEVKDQMEELKDLLSEQTEEIQNLKKQLVRQQRSSEDENNHEEKEGKNLNGYRKAKRRSNVFLD